MNPNEDTVSVAEAAANHHLSDRASRGLLYRDVWGPREKSMGNPWSPENPDGTVILRLAENSLMHNEVGEFIKEQINVQPVNHLTYSTGPRGSRRLRHAAASFWNEEFKPQQPLAVKNIFVTPGLASAIDGLAWSICNEGDGILIPLPLYNGFNVDILNRSNVRVIGVSYKGIEGYSELEDLFDPDVNRKAIEAALRKAKDDGISIRALLISHPHNPLGRCYPPKALEAFASVCGKHGLHFISDEIYAKSVFKNDAIADADPFISSLSLDLVGVIDANRHHVLYGASKDFCANGLRLGLVFTQNEGIMGAMSSISIFSWSPHLLQDTWATMLEDRQWLHKFMDEKATLMIENYHIVTSFFREHGIRYEEPNAGLFIWIDVRHLLLPQSASMQLDFSVLAAESPEAKIYEAREMSIANICIEHGVMIAPGHVYMSEEYGWFRVTFTVGKEALKEGLERLWRSFQRAEAQRQEWN
ncbi:pyridoxal phosphate-dependent transferase [Ilyonectria destructans]|nr:pyridoxal phosphate-dependent transferase [Ilyonectria destructans]